jgi:hypothetical protein
MKTKTILNKSTQLDALLFETSSHLCIIVMTGGHRDSLLNGFYCDFNGIQNSRVITEH